MLTHIIITKMYKIEIKQKMVLVKLNIEKRMCNWKIVDNPIMFFKF